MATPKLRVKIPGLDHCLSEDGQWIRTSHDLLTHYDHRDPRNLPKRQKTERKATSDPRQLPFWDSVAHR